MCRRCAALRVEEPYEPVRAERLTVPQPPPLDWRPASRRAVVTIAVGEEAEACLAAGGRHMRAYAGRLGADFHVLRWPGHPRWPMSAKFALGRVDMYECVAYLDADTLCRRGCVDLFELAGDSDWAAVDDFMAHRAVRSPAPRHLQELYGLRSGLYFNCGVQVFSRRAAPLLLPPEGPIPAFHCGEELFVNAAVQRSGLRLRCLDRRANWQNWWDEGFVLAPDDAVLHWSGAGSVRAHRADHIARAAEIYPCC